MKYIAGIYSLNIADENGNCDWHQASLDWSRPNWHDSDDYPFGEWGIEYREVPVQGEVAVATHARACLDMLYDGHYTNAQGMREYYIGNTLPAFKVFEQVVKMKDCSHWDKIDNFLSKEYKHSWNLYKERRSNG